MFQPEEFGRDDEKVRPKELAIAGYIRTIRFEGGLRPIR
jgi:hypothetical protein